MSMTKFQGTPVQLAGEFVRVGDMAPAFELVKTDLTNLYLKEMRGKTVILNVFPSLDTGVCAASVRKFNKMAAELPDTVVLAIRASDFDQKYGVLMADGPLKGLLARAVVVINREGKIVYTELVPEITQEPNYEKALEAAQKR